MRKFLQNVCNGPFFETSRRILLVERVNHFSLKLEFWGREIFSVKWSPRLCNNDDKGQVCFKKALAWLHQWPVSHLELTHWSRDKMTAIFQETFSDGFSWMKMYEFWLKFHWSLFLRVQITLFQHCSDNGLAPNRQQAIICPNDGLLYWCIYASISLHE